MWTLEQSLMGVKVVWSLIFRAANWFLPVASYTPMYPNSSFRGMNFRIRPPVVYIFCLNVAEVGVTKNLVRPIGSVEPSSALW